MINTPTRELDLLISDVSRQKKAMIREVPMDSTVTDLVDQVVPQVGLPRNDVAGRPLVYKAWRERGGIQFRGDERVIDVFQPEDRAVLQPNIEAG